VGRRRHGCGLRVQGCSCMTALVREPDPWPIIEWLAENMPRALALCPYKVEPQKRPSTERSVMTDAAQKAIDILTAIAEDEDAKPSDETRIRAACAILDRQDKIPAQEGVPA
jgi:hypothetical protein